jgi:hypothetical protein
VYWKRGSRVVDLHPFQSVTFNINRVGLYSFFSDIDSCLLRSDQASDTALNPCRCRRIDGTRKFGGNRERFTIVSLDHGDLLFLSSDLHVTHLGDAELQPRTQYNTFSLFRLPVPSLCLLSRLLLCTTSQNHSDGRKEGTHRLFPSPRLREGSSHSIAQSQNSPVPFHAIHWTK